MKLTKLLRYGAAAAAISFASASFGLSGACAQTAEQFYKGRTITLYVPSAAGGVNDIAGRLVAKHLGDFIPGKPKIIVENLPGAGGLNVANRLYNTFPKDGTVISIIERGTPQVQIEGDPNARFDPLKLDWLGSLSSYQNDAYVLEVNSGFAAKTIDDLKKPGGPTARVGTTAPGSTNRILSSIAKDVLGLRVDLIRGYSGAATIFLAQQTGELDGQAVGFASMKTGQSALWKEGAFRVLLAFGRATRLPALPNVPIARELIKDPKDLALLKFADLPFSMALPLVAPPGIPADRAQALESGFVAMTKDPAFLDEGAKLGLDMSPIDGAAVTQLIREAAATPKETIARYAALVGVVSKKKKD